MKVSKIAASTILVAAAVMSPNAVYATDNWDFSYTGDVQEFTAPGNGTYKIEAWGASGGGSVNYPGGYGGYSVGEILLTKGQKLYVYVGGEGESCDTQDCTVNGGYNGGGVGRSRNASGSMIGFGGGATHISTKEGLLVELENDISEIAIVAGGGAGAAYANSSNYAGGGHGGGMSGTNPVDLGASDYASNAGYAPGTQTTGNAFGQGQSTNASGYAGGGGGFYGGVTSSLNAAGGGSGYIGNSLLTNKSMYCFNCSESSNDATRTVSVQDVAEAATSMYAKIGNGYVKISSVNREYDINIKPVDGVSVSANLSSAKAGVEVSLTIEAEGDRKVDRILVNGSAINGTSFTMPSEDVTIELVLAGVSSNPETSDSLLTALIISGASLIGLMAVVVALKKMKVTK